MPFFGGPTTDPHKVWLEDFGRLGLNFTEGKRASGWGPVQRLEHGAFSSAYNVLMGFPLYHSIGANGPNLTSKCLGLSCNSMENMIFHSNKNNNTQEFQYNTHVTMWLLSLDPCKIIFQTSFVWVPSWFFLGGLIIFVCLYICPQPPHPTNDERFYRRNPCSHHQYSCTAKHGHHRPGFCGGVSFFLRRVQDWHIEDSWMGSGVFRFCQWYVCYFWINISLGQSYTSGQLT